MVEAKDIFNIGHSRAIILPSSFLKKIEKKHEKGINSFSIAFGENDELVLTPVFATATMPVIVEKETIEEEQKKEEVATQATAQMAEQQPQSNTIKLWVCQCKYFFESYDEWRAHAQTEKHLNYKIVNVPK